MIINVDRVVTLNRRLNKTTFDCIEIHKLLPPQPSNTWWDTKTRWLLDGNLQQYVSVDKVIETWRDKN